MELLGLGPVVLQSRKLAADQIARGYVVHGVFRLG
jgi:hypothetical protein